MGQKIGVTKEQLIELLGVRAPDTPQLHDWREVASPVSSARLFAITVEVNGGDHVPCLVYEPRSGPVVGSVIAVHQHNNQYALGKSEVAGAVGDSRMGYGRRIAELGYVVVMPDFRGFEDRRFTNDTAGEQLYALNRIVNGGSLHGEYVSDVIAVIAAMKSAGRLPGELSVIGHSLGGQVAFLTLAISDEVNRGVISSGITTLRSCFRAGILHNPGWYIPGLATFGDYDGIAPLLSQKDTLFLCASADDYFPAEGAAAVLAAIPTAAYEVDWRQGGHALTGGALERIVDWYRFKTEG